MLLIKNKRANYDYQIKDKYSAGVVLTGPEVKSLRQKSGSLTGSYVKIIGNEAWLVNAQINPYPYAQQEKYDPKRTRKLLLTKKQIFKLKDLAKQKNYSLIPLALELINNKIKLQLGVGPGKKQFEKRGQLKEKDLKRQLAREFKRSQLKI
ncbi:MAG: SsrA-binding protein SmpB [Candidatus Pacebacteria bacterium]|nr:SsrA-binding protein SmpB [Candidatus Paceibacterota bacterium]